MYLSTYVNVWVFIVTKLLFLTIDGDFNLRGIPNKQQMFVLLPRGAWRCI